jgi:hypothetical protein
MIDIETIGERLTEAEDKITRAIRAVEQDKTATPALLAVLNELGEKCQRTIEDLEDAEEPVWDHLVELEEAADCAKVAGEAEKGIHDDTRGCIIEAHEFVSGLKSMTEQEFR